MPAAKFDVPQQSETQGVLETVLGRSKYIYHTLKSCKIYANCVQTATQHKTSLLAQKFPSASQPTTLDLSSHMLFTFGGLELAKY